MCDAEEREVRETCVLCDLRELSEAATAVLDSIKSEAWDSMGIVEIRTKSPDVVVPLPDDLEVQISGEDLNMLTWLVRDISTLVEVN